MDLSGLVVNVSVIGHKQKTGAGIHKKTINKPTLYQKIRGNIHCSRRDMQEAAKKPGEIIIIKK